MRADGVRCMRFAGCAVSFCVGKEVYVGSVLKRIPVQPVCVSHADMSLSGALSFGGLFSRRAIMDHTRCSTLLVPCQHGDVPIDFRAAVVVANIPWPRYAGDSLDYFLFFFQILALHSAGSTCRTAIPQ